MPGKFVLKKGSTGKFRFSLLSTNGQVVATSEAYEAKASALKGVQSVRKLAADASLDDQTAPAAKPASAPARKSTKAAPAKRTARASTRASSKS